MSWDAAMGIVNDLKRRSGRELGATLEEARANLAEAVQPVLEANRALAEEAIGGKDVIREPLRLPA